MGKENDMFHQRQRELHPTSIDRELFKMEDSVLQEHRDGYYHLLEGLGFLVCSYFSDLEEQTMAITLNISGRKILVSAEDVLKVTIPSILIDVAGRLADMGEEGYVENINEFVAEKWQGKI